VVVSVSAPEKLQIHYCGLVDNVCCIFDALCKCLRLLNLWRIILQPLNKLIDLSVEVGGIVLDPVLKTSPDLNCEVNLKTLLVVDGIGSEREILQITAGLQVSDAAGSAIVFTLYLFNYLLEKRGSVRKKWRIMSKRMLIK
jgi:hypothetical protein